MDVSDYLVLEGADCSSAEPLDVNLLRTKLLCQESEARHAHGALIAGYGDRRKESRADELTWRCRKEVGKLPSATSRVHLVREDNPNVSLQRGRQLLGELGSLVADEGALIEVQEHVRRCGGTLSARAKRVRVVCGKGGVACLVDEDAARPPHDASCLARLHTLQRGGCSCRDSRDGQEADGAGAARRQCTGYGCVYHCRFDTRSRLAHRSNNSSDSIAKSTKCDRMSESSALGRSWCVFAGLQVVPRDQQQLAILQDDPKAQATRA